MTLDQALVATEVVTDANRRYVVIVIAFGGVDEQREAWQGGRSDLPLGADGGCKPKPPKIPPHKI